MNFKATLRFIQMKKKPHRILFFFHIPGGDQNLQFLRKTIIWTMLIPFFVPVNIEVEKMDC